MPIFLERSTGISSYIMFIDNTYIVIYILIFTYVLLRYIISQYICYTKVQTITLIGGLMSKKIAVLVNEDTMQRCSCGGCLKAFMNKADSF